MHIYKHCTPILDALTEGVAMMPMSDINLAKVDNDDDFDSRQLTVTQFCKPTLSPDTLAKKRTALLVRAIRAPLAEIGLTEVSKLRFIKHKTTNIQGIRCGIFSETSAVIINTYADEHGTVVSNINLA